MQPEMSSLAYICLCMYVHVVCVVCAHRRHAHMCMCKYPQRPEEEARFSTAIITGSFELSAWVLGAKLRFSLRAESVLTH